MTRQQHRKDFTPDTRLALLEGDVDDLVEGQEDMRMEMGRQTKLLTGILVSVTTASILMALNLVVARGGT